MNYGIKKRIATIHIEIFDDGDGADECIRETFKKFEDLLLGENIGPSEVVIHPISDPKMGDESIDVRDATDSEVDLWLECWQDNYADAVYEHIREHEFATYAQIAEKVGMTEEWVTVFLTHESETGGAHRAPDGRWVVPCR